MKLRVITRRPLVGTIAELRRCVRDAPDDSMEDTFLEAVPWISLWDLALLVDLTSWLDPSTRYRAERDGFTFFVADREVRIEIARRVKL